MLTKISICLFLLRITISKAFIRPLQAMIAMLLVSNIIITFLWLVQCRPSLAAAWDSTITGSKCMSVGQLRAIILAQASTSICTWQFCQAYHCLSNPVAVISVLSDFTLAAFPILILRKVQINLRLKVGLCCLMGLGVMLVQSFHVLSRFQLPADCLCLEQVLYALPGLSLITKM